MVSGEREDKIVFQVKRARRSSHHHEIAADLLHRAIEVTCDFASLDAVHDVGEHPIFDVVVHLRSAMDKRDPRPVPPQIQSRFGPEFLPPITTTSVSK